MWFGRICTALAVLLAMVGLVAAGFALLPMPTLDLWVIGLLALEFALVLAVLALCGLLAAVAAVRARSGRARRVTGYVLVTVNGLVLVAATLPAISAWTTANHHAMTLRPGEYLAGLSTSADREPDDRVTYHRVGDRDLKLAVWAPPDSAAESGVQAPVVVNVHGGDGEVGPSPFPRWDAWLAEAGYLVVHVDYRAFASGEWAGPPGDVKCALGWVAEHAERYGGDLERVTLMGQSAGGYLSLLAAYTDHDQLPPSCAAEPLTPDGVIAWYAPGDATAETPSTFRLSEAVRTELLEQWELTPQQWQQASPNSYLDADDPRTLVIQGGRDILQPSENTRAFVDELDQVGVAHELVDIPYADHQFDLSWGGFGSQLARQAILEFLPASGSEPIADR